MKFAPSVPAGLSDHSEPEGISRGSVSRKDAVENMTRSQAPEVRERAVRMSLEYRSECPSQWAAPDQAVGVHWRRTVGRNNLNPTVDPQPSRNPLRRFCLRLLAVFGWRTVFAGFPGKKGIIVVYPHTSNWDFPIGMLFRLGHGMPVHWLAKHSLFHWPFKRLLQKVGGVPIDRRAPQGAIQAIADEFRRRDFMWLAVTPEGTRSYTDHWKSGFYRIARAANVPCGLGFIDYPGKTVGIDGFLTLTGDVATDMEKLVAFYAEKRGFRPEQASKIRLRTPAEPESSAAGRRQTNPKDE